mgnify:CR=1 FL=1
MKKFNILLFITVIILLLLSGWSIFHQPGYSSEDQFVTPTNIHFEKDTLSLGSVKYGTEQKAVFRFTNTGTAPLLIYNVVPSCDCTAVKWKNAPSNRENQERSKPYTARIHSVCLLKT